VAQWSIGICTPVPMVPVDEGKILKDKVAEVARKLEAGIRREAYSFYSNPFCLPRWPRSTLVSSRPNGTGRGSNW